ncbi:MAG: hypothetical protein N3B15_00440 [Planctomycetota bacterium]|nr:hypothetical protein [Planctomycetota bacterium]
MIVCQACGHRNPLRTRYCHACGVRLEANLREIAVAVEEDREAQMAERWLERGRSLFLLGAFFLTCALVLRYAVVPELPPAVMPPIAVGPLLPPPAASAP